MLTVRWLSLLAVSDAVNDDADLNIVSSLVARVCRMARHALNELAAGHECPAYSSEYLDVKPNDWSLVVPVSKSP